ncbi:MAG: serine hydrolase domain-containing protein, partial [Bacteroidota bacterium]
QFQQVLDTTYTANQDAVGILISVQSEEHGISWTQAVGYSEKNTKKSLQAEQPVLIASNTKTYVAAAILKLVEERKIRLQDKIKKLLKPETRSILSSAGYNLKSITVEYLLSHTSGIRDYVDSTYFNFVDENPQYGWTRAEQIALSARKGEPFTAPGQQFSYGDINYLLLTEIIETKTNQPFYLALRQLLGFQDLGIYSTWFEQLEDRPQGVSSLAHQYWRTRDWDSYEINPSWDLYGGGGLASTVGDLATFSQKLFNQEIITDPVLLSKMYEYVLPQEQSNYCLGVRNISFHGLTGYYHGGFWGTDVMYLPKYDLTIAVFTLEKDKRNINAALSFEIIKLVQAKLDED